VRPLAPTALAGIGCWCLGLCVLVALSAGLAIGQPQGEPAPKNKEKAPAPPPETEWDQLVFPEHRGRAFSLLLATQLAEINRPGAALSLVNVGPIYGNYQEVVRGQLEKIPSPPDKTPKKKGPIDPRPDRDMLTDIVDGRPLLPPHVNWGEAHAFNYLIIRARDVGENLLATNSRRDITYANLMNTPRRYRGQIIQIIGYLRRLIALPSPELENDGIAEYYEGWIRSDNFMYCVVFSKLPEGLQPGDSMNVRVGFNGYFFKRYRYTSSKVDKDKNPEALEVPLLIGATLTPLDRPGAGEGESFTTGFLYSFLGVVAATIGIAVFLGLYFRKGDRAVQSRVSAARYSTFIEPGADGTSGAASPPTVTEVQPPPLGAPEGRGGPPPT
jgi:hypothetical protein